MKTISCIILFLVVITVTLAQITFTREWVKGKRSTAAHAKEGHDICRNLGSVVEYLIELEKLRKAECAEKCNSSPSAFPTMDIQRSPSDFMTFLRDIPSMEQPRPGIDSPVTEQRNQ